VRLAILAIGMSEKNDSVCNDVAYQYKVLSSQKSNVEEVRIFAGNYDARAFPELPVENAAEFERWLTADPDVVVIFHYCDSRSQFDDFLRNKCKRVVVRWHNATPPWFTFGSQNQNANHALLGYENIIDFIKCVHVSFWTNSGFTRDQLVAMGTAPERCHVVFPASRYLDSTNTVNNKSIQVSGEEKSVIDLLFVSRVVAHKGHLNAIAVADRTQEITGRAVRLNIVGKGIDEPSAFSAKLRSAIKKAKSEIVIHGLVSDEKLIELYQTSTVFICLSEHEGFGLPVFEAMRYRLPVVAWATTAFRELLVNHPFAFPNFDLDLFAASIGALENENVKSRLLELQNSVLQSYSSDILIKQISSALSAQESSWGQPIPDDLARPAIRYLPIVAEAIDTARSTLITTFPRGFDDELIFDSHVNVTSLYDLQIYKSYLNQDKQLLKALTVPVREPSITFRPDEFSMRKGVYPASASIDHPTPNPDDVSADHLVFGPYAQMPAGTYNAKLHAITTIISRESVSFEIDVISGGQQLTSQVFNLPPGSHETCPKLSFSMTGEAPMVEIRLRAESPFKGYILFSGVTLTQTGATQLSVATEELSLFPTSNWIGRLKGIKLFAKFSREREAKSLFRRGNAARERGEWGEAARLYDMGLSSDSERFEYIVQAAHMHKENGNLETSRQRYNQALNLRPNDADLCLQMGHFCKIAGDMNAARVYYLKALQSFGSVAADAGNELIAISSH